MPNQSMEFTDAASGNLQAVWSDAQGVPATMPGEGDERGAARLDAQEQEQERLLVEHLPTVRYIARKIHGGLPQQVELEDLISAGVLGLLDAFSKFDANKAVQFKTYAQFRIRGAIIDSLRALDWSPRDLRRKGRAVEEAVKNATQQLGRSPEEEEIAATMNLDLGEYQKLLGELCGLKVGSLHVEHSEESGDEEIAYVQGSPEEDSLFLCMEGEMKQLLADAIENLPERDRLVMMLYYFEELTMKEIGMTLGVVESRVSQIHTSAVVRLRAALGAGRGTRKARRVGLAA